ncbi:hypothetical protein GCM10025864_39770 [Luteimicrobium album]|uniref:Holin n=1 Tax=Luteimicrobium album TaxID=1054550 RepID=A0ABQ6I605_9MICO|nr:hypothetical protein [Luteimicrobium album]GMA26218.1 hypothetical protein GCM10025864_39770 [Luteimicrobium album]
MNLIPDKLQHAAKAVVAALGAVVAVLLQVVPSLPDEWQAGLTGVVAVLTAIATYWVPNLQRILNEDPDDSAPAVELGDVDPSEAQDTAEPTDGTGVISDPAVTNPSPDFTPDA